MRQLRQQLAHTHAQPGRAQVPAPTTVARSAARAFRPTSASRTSRHLRIGAALQALVAPRLPHSGVALSPSSRDDRGRDEIQTPPRDGLADDRAFNKSPHISQFAASARECRQILPKSPIPLQNRLASRRWSNGIPTPCAGTPLTARVARRCLVGVNLSKLRAGKLRIGFFSAVLSVVPGVSVAQSGPSPTTPRPSIGESISSSVKQGVDRVGQAVTPKPQPPDDPVALQGKGKPSVDLYVAVARLYEEKNQLNEAEAQYKRALQDAPNDLRPLLGYARLKDRMGDPQAALQLYQKAARLHPQEPAVHNNLAVHYARRGMLQEAVGAMERAIQARPKAPKYRNNMATLLVEMGRPQDAFVQLRAVNDEAVAHYNLGFLLHKKGQTQAAAQEFALALRANPNLAQARQMLDLINNQQARGPARPDARLAARPTAPPSHSAPPPAPNSPYPAGNPQPPIVRQLPSPPGLEGTMPPGSRPADMRGPGPSPSPTGVPSPRRLPPVGPMTQPATMRGTAPRDFEGVPPELVAPMPPIAR